MFSEQTVVEMFVVAFAFEKVRRCLTKLGTHYYGLTRTKNLALLAHAGESSLEATRVSVTDSGNKERQQKREGHMRDKKRWP